MIKQITGAAALSLLLAGCVSVPMADPAASSKAKQFAPPSPGQAGLYIYRSGSFGGALKKDIFVDGQCVGESAPDVFFYKEVAGGAEHTIATESEFSPNELKLNTAANTNYFIRQYIKIGVVVGGANLEQVNEAEGKKAVQQLNLAVSGTCGA